MSSYLMRSRGRSLTLRCAPLVAIPVARCSSTSWPPALFEVDLLRMKTREDMAVGRSKGKLHGKPPKLSARRQAHLIKQHATGEHTNADLAELFSVSRATVYRVLEARGKLGALTTRPRCQIFDRPF
ncbi:helix-turn-helix domain-containing protein [Streptomyces sp. Qhu-G9]|uniref:helix-turn-helix domain-containing protein n=1 Tax=Streptomyces sp. Qhu-G9 TaxID=3452799 RepID=UPI003AF54D84